MASPGSDSERQIEPTMRTAVRRHRDRAHYDRQLISDILDEALVCHVGFVGANGPVVLPMAHLRMENNLYLHGAPANAMLNALTSGGDVCVTVTLLDGLVLARSAFHHSMNYRCVTVFGVPEKVVDDDETVSASLALVNHMVEGRGAEVRAPSPSELRKTLFVRLAINEASAKVREGGPADDDADMELSVWAGHVPLTLTRGKPMPDQRG